MNVDLQELLARAERDCAPRFAAYEENELAGTRRVLAAFSKRSVALRHFAPTTGYGYDDIGRDTLEGVFADLFGADAALVRPHITCGTHALSVCLFGLLRPGDELLSVTGAPYDTLHGVIGIAGGGACSLAEMGVTYRQVEMDAGGLIDLPAVLAAVTEKTRVALIQRSRGYAWRRTLTPAQMRPVIDALHRRHPHVIVMVDNCYGEFVCAEEPTHAGADIVVGSLIKNPGGGIAPTGGYLAGREDCVRRVAYRLTAPGLGGEVGSYEATYRPFYQGLFMAPHTVCQALKTATLAARVFELLGLRTTPASGDERADIIQALDMGTPERLIAFCRGIQAASPVDSNLVPEPWDMPGYQHKVIMAAGTFVGGASIELSADGPLREPYTAYMQGGLTYAHGKLAILSALTAMQRDGCL